jgi:hypothetical protein
VVQGRQRPETTTVLPTNIKLGLTEHIDAQLIFTPNVRVRASGRARRASATPSSG